MSAQRNTVQRQLILDTIKKLRIHPTIDEIYSEIHQGHPSISKTTVYRNLRKLADEGLIRRISLPDGLERYDGTTAPHYHFNCKKCGGITDVDIDYLANLNKVVDDKYGVSVDEHDVVFLGTCSKCNRANK